MARQNWLANYRIFFKLQPTVCTIGELRLDRARLVRYW
jgi:hypothetical protein